MSSSTESERTRLDDVQPLPPTYRRGRSSTESILDADPELDGRKARGIRNRQAVVDAILTLLGDGTTSPTAREIADTAGVSLRSVFRHFDDLDTLFLAAIERQAEHTADLYEPPDRSGCLEDRIASLVSRRRRLYERIFPVRRGWMLRYHDHPRVSAILTEVYDGLYGQVADLFSDDVSVLSTTGRQDLLFAVDAITSFDTWAHLRVHRELGVTRASAVVRSMIRAQFALAES